MNKNLFILSTFSFCIFVSYLFYVFVLTAQPEKIETTKEKSYNDFPESLVIHLDSSEGETIGTAEIKRFESSFESVEVIVKLNSFEATVPQPVHIYKGDCLDVGDIAHALTLTQNGMSSTVLDASFDRLKHELPLVVNVHKSFLEPQVNIACGIINF